MQLSQIRKIAIVATLLMCTGVIVSAAELEVVAESRMQWTGIAVTDDQKIFVNFPRWSPAVTISVARLDSLGTAQPFPSSSWNSWKPGEPVRDDAFVAVQSVVRDARNRIWVLDTGNPYIMGVIPGGARLFCFDPDTGRELRRFSFGPEIARQGTYLNDVRIDLGHDHAYITDSGEGGLIVLDMHGGIARRLLDGHPAVLAEETDIIIGGQPWKIAGKTPQVHSDGIAYVPKRDCVYFQALTGRTLYCIDASILRDTEASGEKVAAAVKAVLKHSPVDGILAGPDGAIYLSNLEQSSVDRWTPGAEVERIVGDERLAWPDSFSLTAGGWLYVATSQIHLGPHPDTPYLVLRIKVY
jgi:sugar lactone lactonase YvrE